MSIRNGLAEAIGNTPLIRLNHFSELTGCEILGKAEFMNPGGSVKDRAARAIIDDAERSGRLLPGGTVVEGTAGNRAAKSRRGDGINSVRILAADGHCSEYCPDHDLRCVHPAHRFGQHGPSQ